MPVGEFSMTETIALIIQWAVAPVAAFVWALHAKTGRHDTELAVLKARADAEKLAHDREMKDVKDALKNISFKLDNIELALRDR